MAIRIDEIVENAKGQEGSSVEVEINHNYCIKFNKFLKKSLEGCKPIKDFENALNLMDSNDNCFRYGAQENQNIGLQEKLKEYFLD